MKVWIVVVEYENGCCSDAYDIDDVYDSEQKAKKAAEELYHENPNQDLNVQIYEKTIH